MISFRGSFVALITPFRKGCVDLRAFERQIEFQVQAGTHGIVPCGTTGESPTLSHKEHRDVIAAAVKTAGGRIPVIAGTGSNSTEEAIELTRFAKKTGADAALSVVPYYNKPTQEGLYLHFKTLAAKCNLPIVLYNIPGRCGVSLTTQTIERLSKIDSIVAIKEASGQMDQTSEILCRTSLTVLSGDDSLTLPLLSLGAQGVVSVLANIFPRELLMMLRAFSDGNLPLAQKIHKWLYPLVKALFVETNPVPVKTAMKILKRDTGEVRLPLSPMKKDHADLLRREIASLKNRFSDMGECER